jgi:hypothetical protein
MSSGGKPQRLQVLREACARGVGQVGLRLGDDVAALVHDAIENGADAFGASGPDVKVRAEGGRSARGRDGPPGYTRIMEATASRSRST